MTESTLKEIVSRAVSDAAFRTQLRNDPAKALSGIQLTAEERTALTSGDPTRLTALGIDQRMSKAFVVGSADGASRVVIHDPDNTSNSVLTADETTGATGASTWDANLRANEGVIGDPTAGAGASGASTWDANLRMNEGNIDTGATQFATEDDALIADRGASSSAWDASLRTNEGNIDTGASESATALENEGSPASSWDSHLNAEEGKLDNSSVQPEGTPDVQITGDSQVTEY